MVSSRLNILRLDRPVWLACVSRPPSSLLVLIVVAVKVGLSTLELVYVLGFSLA
jgi:hypothetical protein